MCVTAPARIMGCGKSRHQSPDVSENDFKTQGSLKKESRQSYSKNPKNKKGLSGCEKGDTSNDTNGGKFTNNFATSSPSMSKTRHDTSQSTRKESNGKNKSRDGFNNTKTSQSVSSTSRGASTSSSQGDTGKSNGATKTQGSYYVLEVPNEIFKVETSSRTTGKEGKAGSKSTKNVHATTSQLEFFKMLDEKIEMGSDYPKSNEASGISLASEASTSKI